MSTNVVSKEVKMYRGVADTMAKINVLREKMNDQLVKYPDARPTIGSPSALASYAKTFLENLDHEEFLVICLDTRNRVMSVTPLYRGTVNTSPVRAAEVFRQAVILNATSIVVAHNHPSGDPTPSAEDVSVTKGLKAAGDVLEIQVFDHVVIGSEGRFVSLREKGLM